MNLALSLSFLFSYDFICVCVFVFLLLYYYVSFFLLVVVVVPHEPQDLRAAVESQLPHEAAVLRHELSLVPSAVCSRRLHRVHQREIQRGPYRCLVATFLQVGIGVQRWYKGAPYDRYRWS